ARLYREVKAHLDAARAEAIIVIANDHFNTFFLNNFPTFAIGVAETSSGPNDQTKMPRYDFKVHFPLAEHLRRASIADGFDLWVRRDFGAGRALVARVLALPAGVPTPAVPMWVNPLVKPLPSARRCYALGRALRGAIESFPQKLRVAVLGSGSFSLEIGG